MRNLRGRRAQANLRVWTDRHGDWTLTATSDRDADEILFSVKGRVGFVRLNRPRALNSLTREMCVAMHAQLGEWAADTAVDAVIIEGEGEKAFCAGGDVVRVARSAQEGTDAWWRFFHDEYRNNSLIGRLPKPYAALIDGITMGGGVGVSVHGDYRVATERTLFAMPETGLGLIPDVGGSHFLPRLPGETGMYLALTGYRAKAADCLYLGVATHYMPSETLTAMKAALVDRDDRVDMARLGVVLDEHASAPGEAPLAEHRAAIDRHFAQDSVEAILGSLDADDSDWAQKTAKILRGKSPTSLKLSFELLRRGAALDLDDCLRMEYRVVRRIMTMDTDFFEGVRSILIDKDNAPRWSPATLDAVDDAAIAAHFENLGDSELKLD